MNFMKHSPRFGAYRTFATDTFLSLWRFSVVNRYISHFHRSDSFQSSCGFQNYWIKLSNNVIRVIYKAAFWEIIFMNYAVKIQVCKLRGGESGFAVDDSL